MDTWVAATFWLLWIMLLWTWVYKYLIEFLLVWVFTPRSGIAGSFCNSIFIFLKDHYTISHSSCTILHYYQQWVLLSSIFLNTCNSAFFFFWTITILMDVKWYLMALIWISLLIRYWASFHVFSGHLYTFRDVYSSLLPI